MDSSLVDQVRRFNRTVTQRIGALNDAFLARDRPLGQARLLWEIGPDGSDVWLLRSRLDLDSGYLSRLLRSLENDGLVVVEPSGTDGRVRTAHLTGPGLAERAVLDRRSDDVAGSILEPLSPRQRTRLITAMAEVERLLVASMVRVAVCDPRQPDARSCLRAYFSELACRFDGGFDPARSISADDEELTPPAGLLLVATLHAEPVGCGAVKFRHGAVAQAELAQAELAQAELAQAELAQAESAQAEIAQAEIAQAETAQAETAQIETAEVDTAEIKRMWVAPAVRGLGLGGRLLADLEARAAANGVRTLRLETNRALEEAIGLYRAAGYREVAAFNDEPYADHWFEKTLDRSAPAPTPSAPAPNRSTPMPAPASAPNQPGVE
jgi:ribosomal protein S18 acetylase RimI-like enzyme/DNA-binding MarR family transcriptional regulator